MHRSEAPHLILAQTDALLRHLPESLLDTPLQLLAILLRSRGPLTAVSWSRQLRVTSRTHLCVRHRRGQHDHEPRCHSAPYHHSVPPPSGSVTRTATGSGSVGGTASIVSRSPSRVRSSLSLRSPTSPAAASSACDLAVSVWVAGRSVGVVAGNGGALSVATDGSTAVIGVAMTRLRSCTRVR